MTAPAVALQLDPRKHEPSAGAAEPAVDSRIEARFGKHVALALCFLAAMLDGVDIQSMSLVASRLGSTFDLGAAEIGYIATATVISGGVGAACGGRLSDRIGRKTVLILSLSALGLFSFLTAFAQDFTSLLVARALTAMGMGGALLSLVAVVGEVAPAGRRAGAIGLMYCGMPLGGAAGGLLLYFGEPQIDWRAVFYVGGLGPLILVPLFILAFRERRAARIWRAPTAAVAPAPEPVLRALFGGRRGVVTLCLWASFIFTFMATNLLVNWLPWLMMGKGLTRAESVLIGTVMSLGAVPGILTFGRVVDAGKPFKAVLAMYLGTALSLAALSGLNGFWPLAAAACAAGFCGIGGQLVLYVLALQSYPEAVKGTGLGAASVAGKVGSMTGPLIGGAALAAGVASAAVLAVAVPGLLIAGVAASVVLSRTSQSVRQAGVGLTFRPGDSRPRRGPE